MKEPITLHDLANWTYEIAESLGWDRATLEIPDDGMFRIVGPDGKTIAIEDLEHLERIVTNVQEPEISEESPEIQRLRKAGNDLLTSLENLSD